VGVPMIAMRLCAITLVAIGGAAAPSVAQTLLAADRRILAEFDARVHAYVQVKDAARTTVLPLVVLPDPGEIRRRSDALATLIKSARYDARRGDIFTPAIENLIRLAIRRGCEEDYAALLALVDEERDAPLPEPAIHGRWPAAAPLPTMPPDILAALPPLPPGLQYRFMTRALVLLDIDANLIIDFVPDAIPITTVTASRSLALR
jgi:hypothetical protein